MNPNMPKLEKDDGKGIDIKTIKKMHIAMKSKKKRKIFNGIDLTPIVDLSNSIVKKAGLTAEKILKEKEDDES